jgi:hypothetical protein
MNSAFNLPKETTMQIIVGYILIFLGIAFLVLSVLVWFGVLKPLTPQAMLAKASGWDVLLALIQKLPWMATVGLLLIYGGLKMIGVVLPF